MPHPRTCFNSIKVRLERMPMPLPPFGKWFQFHKGTIRTFIKMGDLLRNLFQFHKGTIRTVVRLNMSEYLGRFNSIKVRLELITL